MTILEITKIFEKMENKKGTFPIKTVTGDYTISTVYLGIDHSFGLGKPLYYETMIFPNGSWDEIYCTRYETEEEAIEGHREAIEWLAEKYL